MNENTKMRTQTLSSSGFKNVAVSHPMGPEIQAGSLNHFSPRVLEISSELQTTLQLEELIKLFFELTSTDVPYDGLAYEAKPVGIQMEIGHKSMHQCNYQLVIADNKLGAITFFRDHAFSEQDLVQLENLLCALIYPLRNSLLYHQALQSALTDPLTGVKNRASLENAMAREVELAHRHGTGLSVIVLDIDFFKMVNDHFGHAVGDLALCSVAQCVRETIRGTDMLFRYGGEEFVILLSCTKRNGALLLAERIRQAIEGLVFAEPQGLKLTASLGVTELCTKDTPLALFKRADTALYQAKNNGRNQVIFG